MAKARSLAQEQLRALDRLKQLPGIERFYLAGASAIAWHLGHRQSVDLDLFSLTERLSLEPLLRAARRLGGTEVTAVTDVMLELRVLEVPVDLVRYSYPLLEPPRPGPRDFPTAGLRDLSAMKLAAVSRRGIRRDFWDLFEINRAGLSLREAADAYVERFSRGESDLYHVQRALTWFEDAERDPRWPQGLSKRRWTEIKKHFVLEAPKLL